MMRRMLIAIVGTALLVGLSVAPVGAAKGGPGPGGPPSQPKIQTIEGTYSGTNSSQTLGCAWDPQRIWGAINFGGWSFTNVKSDGNLVVRSSVLGRGLLTYNAMIFSGGGPWTFTASDFKSHLYGGGNVNLGSPSFPYKGNVFAGDGKFFSVKAGEITLDRQPIDPGSPCQGVDNTLGGLFPDTSQSWPTGGSVQRVNAEPIVSPTSGWLVGYLQYG